MIRKLRPHLTYANVISTLCLVLVLGGGAAYAANTVFSTDIVDGEVKTPDLAANAVLTGKVANESLTGADIDNQSGVDTCTHGTTRAGELCFVVSASAPQQWLQAVGDCATQRLRLPSFAEAVVLAQRNLPHLSDQDMFWTSEYWDEGVSGSRSFGVSDAGGSLDSSTESTYDTVCVTTPTN